MSLPQGWLQCFTPEGRAFYQCHSTQTTHWEPPRPPPPPPPTHATKYDFVSDLKKMFPSWEDGALAEVLASCNGNKEAALDRLLSWTFQDQAPPHAPPQTRPTAAVRDDPLPLALAESSLLEEAHTSRPLPRALLRGDYDNVMAARLAGRIPPSAVKTLLKAMSVLKHRAAKARENSGRKLLDSPPKEHVILTPRSLSREEKILEGKQLLAQRLAFLGLTDIQMVDDGNCQYRAFSQELFNSQSHHAGVRGAIVRHLVAHESEFAAFVGGAGEFRAYVAEMSRSGSWGDEISLQVACDCFDVEVHLISTEKEHFHMHYSPSHPGPGPRRRLFLSYISHIHYNVVAPQR